MAARVTATEVKAILDDSALEDTIVDSYILGAHALINSVLTTGAEDVLKEIERWLTAHMISCTRERMAAKEGAGGASITYTGEYAEALHSTPYGQMVLVLDSSGLLATLGKKAVMIYAVTSFK